MVSFADMPDLLTIGEVAKRSGVASSALRFYEDRGLIASQRAGSGHRRYPQPDPSPAVCRHRHWADGCGCSGAAQLR